MNPDELDDVLRGALGHGDAGVGGPARFDEIAVRGRARRRRRQTALAGTAAAVVLVGGLTFATRRPGPTAGLPSATTTTTAAGPTTTVVPTATGVTATTTTGPTTGPPVGPPPTIEAVVQEAGGLLDLVRGQGASAGVEPVDPCAGVDETPCDVPVVTVDTDLWFLRRTPSRREIVHHHDGVNDVVFAGDAIDFAIGPTDALGSGPGVYVVASDGVLSRRYAAGDAVVEVARGVREVVVAPDGRLAWVTAAGIVVPAFDGTTRTIPFAEPPSQLSFAPSGPRLLARTADGRRTVVDTTRTDGLVAFDATAACWGLTDTTIYAYDGADDRDGHVSAVNPRTGAGLRVDDAPFSTGQIACTPSGAVAYVQPDGVFVSTVPGSNVFSYVGGRYERVRSVR